ncbi:MAG: hypothetical protein K2X38_15165 [Gemmataceae bacterium]|nr:hypothetical protein [Gemmataceae bacterium]
MRRIISAAAFLALCIQSAGCMDPRRTPPRQEAGNPPLKMAGNSIFAPVRLDDPLERNKAAEGIKKPAFYQVKGKDETGLVWEGYLVVEHAPEAYMTFGHFEWQCERGGGRYHFKGTYDADKRKARWTGYTVKEKIGTAANSIYKATLSADGKKLEDGSWKGGVAIPGIWEGEFLHGTNEDS